jgi:hypothetical protein
VKKQNDPYRDRGRRSCSGNAGNLNGWQVPPRVDFILMKECNKECNRTVKWTGCVQTPIMRKVNWDMLIGFWLGIGVLTLVSIARTALHQTLYQYDWYIVTLTIIVLILVVILRKRSTNH